MKPTVHTYHSSCKWSDFTFPNKWGGVSGLFSYGDREKLAWHDCKPVLENATPRFASIEEALEAWDKE